MTRMCPDTVVEPFSPPPSSSSSSQLQENDDIAPFGEEIVVIVWRGTDKLFRLCFLYIPFFPAIV